MSFTLFGVAFIFGFTILGYFRGALRILAAFASLLLAGILARPLSFVFKSLLAGTGWIPKALIPLAAILAAGICLFLAIFSIAEIFLRQRRRRRVEENLAAMGTTERRAGAMLGALWGLLLVVIIFAGIDLIGTVEQAMTGASNATKASGPQESPDSQFAQLKKGVDNSLFGPLVQTANPMDEKASRTFRDLTLVIGDPVLLEKFKNHPTVARFAQDPRIVEIAQDQEISGYMQRSDFYRLLDNEKIAALVQEKDLYDQLKNVDMGAILKQVIEEGRRESEAP